MLVYAVWIIRASGYLRPGYARVCCNRNRDRKYLFLYTAVQTNVLRINNFEWLVQSKLQTQWYTVAGYNIQEGVPRPIIDQYSLCCKVACIVYKDIIICSAFALLYTELNTLPPFSIIYS